MGRIPPPHSELPRKSVVPLPINLDNPEHRELWHNYIANIEINSWYYPYNEYIRPDIRDYEIWLGTIQKDNRHLKCLSLNTKS